MESFLSSLKKESQEYTKTAVAIDEIQRGFSARFEELEDQANLTVKNLKRPMTVMQKSRIAKGVKVRPRNVKSELARSNFNQKNRKVPHTARNFSKGNDLEIDYRRKPKKSSPNPKMWVTDDVPVSCVNETDSSTAFNKINFPNIYFSKSNEDNDYDERKIKTRRQVLQDPFQISSHHFECDYFEDSAKTARKPKINKKWTSPVCVRKIERKLSDDERLYNDVPNEEKIYVF